MRIKQIVRRILVLILALVCMSAFAVVAYAADISVSANSTSVKIGDTVTVTVTVSASHIAVADGVFTYDPALLTYISSNGGASDGYINLVSLQEGGSSSLTALIKFAAIGDGEAVIDVSMENILNYNEEAQGDAQAGVSITIASSGTDSSDDPDSEPTPTIDWSQTGIAAQNVMGTDAQMYIWPSLRNVSLPSGFTDRQVTYKDEYVGGAAIPDNEDIILLYLSEASGENAGYYIYDALKDVFSPYLTVTSISTKFTLLWPDESVEAPDGYEQTTLVIKEKEMPAWTQFGSDGSIYLVYVRSASGETGFYLYNVEDRSLQRYSAFAPVSPEPDPTQQPTPTAAPTAEPVSAQIDEEKTDGGIQIDPTLLIILVAACALFAAAAVVLAVLYIRIAAHQKKQRRKTINIKKADV